MTNFTVSMLHKVTASIILFGIANLFAFCLAIPLMSMMGMNDGMPCGMDHATELCPMVLNDHLAFWQKIMIPISLSVSLLSFLVAVVVVVISLKDTAALEALRRLRFLRYHAGASPPLVDYLQQKFSQGILHPKIH